jgi:hypothetical protein
MEGSDATVLRCCLSRVSVCFQVHGLPSRADQDYAFEAQITYFYPVRFPLDFLVSGEEGCLPEEFSPPQPSA